VARLLEELDELELLVLELLEELLLDVLELDELELLGELEEPVLTELLLELLLLDDELEMSAAGAVGTAPASMISSVASAEAPLAYHACVSRLPSSSDISYALPPIFPVAR
jgi:hypothetical protein